MAEWKRLAAKSDLPDDGEAKEFALGDKMICIASVDGAYSALDNVCAHRGGPLGQGVVLDGKVVCPWHGWEYDMRTGQHGGAARIRLRKFVVVQRDGQVYLVLP